MDEKTLKKVRHWIVDNYGQDMIKLLTNIAPIMFEYPEELKTFLSTYFEPSRELAIEILNSNEVSDFKAMLYGMIDIPKENADLDNEGNKTPEQLMDEAGYILYPECQTEADIQSFRHYYYRGEDVDPLSEFTGGDPEPREGEELCTFDGDRLDICRVWFAVKKNVDEIRREDFTNPKREDEYGTSVISIQFTRDENSTLSIKNRYNHTVNNPDATFYNNLDIINCGLTEAFSRAYGVEEKKEASFDSSEPLKNLDLENFVKAENPRDKGGKENEKLYKFNNYINGIYYCDNNVIIKDGEVIEDKTTMPPEKKRLIDYFVFDFENKTVTIYDPTIKDAFVDTLQPIKNIQTPRGKIVITKDVKDENGEYEQVVIDVNDSNQITGISHKNLVECGDFYLFYNKTIEKVDLPNLEITGEYFLYKNESLTELSLPSWRKTGDCAIGENIIMKKLYAPKLKTCGFRFLYSNEDLTELDLSSLEESGGGFLSCNRYLTELNMPNWIKTGNSTLKFNSRMKKLYAPKLEECGYDFLYFNEVLTEVDLSSLRKCGDQFLKYNQCLAELNLPSLEESGNDFLFYNRSIERFYAPQWRKTGDNTLGQNRKLKILYAPKLEECGNSFLANNLEITYLDLPRLKKCGFYFLRVNKIINRICLTSLEESGDYFLEENQEIKEMEMPSWRKTGRAALAKNEKIRKLYAPKLEECGGLFFARNLEITELDLPSLIECGDEFFHNNFKITSANLPSLERSGTRFFFSNESMVKLIVPKWRMTGDCSLSYNRRLKELIAPNLMRCGTNFLFYNTDMIELDLPHLFRCEEGFMVNNSNLKMVNLPELQVLIPDEIFSSHSELKEILSGDDLLITGILLNAGEQNKNQSDDED